MSDTQQAADILDQPASRAPFAMVEPHTPFSAYPSERLMRRVEATPFPRNVSALLREKAEAHPDRPLLHLIDDGIVLSYAALRDNVARLASGLYRLGIRRGSHVGLMLNTAQTYPISWLALATLGAVTVPINYAYTSRELEFVLTDANCLLLIIDREYLTLFQAIARPPLSREQVIVAGDEEAGWCAWGSLLAEGDAAFVPTEEPALDDAMNIQYTSGTTGLPKGAILSHRGLMMHGRVGSAQLRDSATNFLVAQPFHYITGQWQFLMTLLQGGTAFMPRRQSSTRFMSWVKDYRIHFCNFPEIISRAPEVPEDAANELKVLYCYSHRLENYRWYERRYGCVARQGFSMTETALVTYVPVEADHMTGTGTCGIPAAFRDVRICDPRGVEVPAGEMGELCVRGPGMLLGYWNRPEATREAFHPGGWFRTGDLARRDSQGWVWYLGRLKDMVKRSGENISATEVEAVLRGVEGIVEAAVLPVPDPIRGEEVKAYVLLSPEKAAADVPPERIVAACSKDLAKFKIPRYLEYVTEFPRTPGGKIRKSELRKAKADLTAGSYDVQERRWNA